MTQSSAHSSQAGANSQDLLTAEESPLCSPGLPSAFTRDVARGSAGSVTPHLASAAPCASCIFISLLCKEIRRESTSSLVSRPYQQKPFVSHLTKLSLFPGSSRCLSPTGLQQEFAVADPAPASARDLLLCWHAALPSLRLLHCCLAASKAEIHEAMFWRKPIRMDRRNISHWLRD